MPLPAKLHKETLARFDELISQGESFTYQGDSPSYFAVVEKEMYVEWKASCATILARVVPRDHLHWQWIEGLNETHGWDHDVKTALSRVRSIREDYSRGLLGDVTLQIEAELAADYIGQAEHLLAEGQPGKYDHVPAAVLTGAVLEKALRTLCDGQAPPIQTTTDKGNPRKMNVMIDDLKKAGVYNEMKAKQLRAWAGIRNLAAHGEFDQFARGDVEDMISGVNRFLGDYLG